MSRAQYEQAVAERDALRAQLATAQRNAQVAADQLRIADNGVDNTVVRAPFAGVVIAKAAQPGEIVSPLSAGGGFTRTGIGTIVDMDSLEVEVDVGEAFIGRVQPKMPVEAMLNAYPDWKIPAEVIAIIPTADRGKATVKVRVALEAEGSAHRARHGRAGELPRSAPTPAAHAERQAGVLAPADADRPARRQGRGLRRRRATRRSLRTLKLGRTLGRRPRGAGRPGRRRGRGADARRTLADGARVRWRRRIDPTRTDEQRATYDSSRRRSTG